MLFLTTSGYDLDAELRQTRNLVDRGVDGLVLRGDCHHDVTGSYPCTASLAGMTAAPRPRTKLSAATKTPARRFQPRCQRGQSISRAK